LSCDELFSLPVADVLGTGGVKGGNGGNEGCEGKDGGGDRDGLHYVVFKGEYRM
jgi:hypothetical protein